MNRWTSSVLVTLAMATVVPAADQAGSQCAYPVQAVPYSDVEINDGFWTPRIETNRTVTIPYSARQSVVWIPRFAFIAPLQYADRLRSVQPQYGTLQLD